ncbi:hypothetical protein PGH12_16755 [Chryseobacterium wangxinyae]|uniref:hypothetical protein n=1 Tax=Chryseobacterium sp. CY350 TaxID=2997336 RepID=UPI00227179E2|nr:hypothetical protein [Chryseobacterium sp. CY350]WBZ95095.1 hypothetical protein PGH12_16755 [Chryseobacterium sp. CY350]
MEIHLQQILKLLLLKIFLILFGAFIIISCQKEERLLNVNYGNKLEILNVDDKCGEWGGDQKQLIIYRDDFKGQLLADYSEKIGNCDNVSESKITKSVKRIKITDEDSDLIIKIIDELTENKINRKPTPSHSGIFNRIILSDSSMIINDFPSIELKNFKKLIDKIEQKQPH